MLRGPARGTLSLVFLAMLIPGCQSGGPAGAQPTSAPASQANASSSTQESNAPTSPAGNATPGGQPQGSPTAATWTVTLAGPRSGAGTYSRSGLVTCTLIPDGSGGSILTAAMIDLGAAFGDLTDWQMNEQAGVESLFATAGGLDTGLWRADSLVDTAEVSATIVSGVVTHVSGRGRWSDGEGQYTIAIESDCSALPADWGGGTD